MGYRSDVCIECEEKAFEMFKNAFVENNFIPDRIFVDNSYDIATYTFFYDYVKWYEGCGYKEVDALVDVMDILCGDEYLSKDGYGFEYSRIGEEYSDIEGACNGWYGDVGIVRTFSDPCGVEYELEK